MALFTLLNNDVIETGPRDWNPAYFQYFLSNLGIDCTLPDAPLLQPLIFNDSVKLVPTVEAYVPQCDSTYERLVGPKFKYEDGNYISYYDVEELPIDMIRTNVKSLMANRRWVKETTPIIRNINDKTITLYTDRETRSIYAQALQIASDDYNGQWKFEEGFYNISKQDLEMIVSEIATYVQSCFDEESMLVSTINTASIEEIKQLI